MDKNLEAIIAKYKEEHPEATDADIIKLLETQPKSGLLSKMTALVEKVMDEKLAGFEEELQKRLTELTEEKETEFIDAMAKSLGIDEDHPVTRSELEPFVREFLLKAKENGETGRSGEVKKDKDGNPVDEDGNLIEKAGEETEFDYTNEFNKYLKSGPGLI